MMPPRAVLNAYYAWKVKGLDAKQRKQFDADLNGWTAQNEAANRALQEAVMGGGEG
jgi:hypothetical protein